MAKPTKWTGARLDAAMKEWSENHPQNFYAEYFFKKNGIPKIRSKRELQFTIKRKHINEGDCCTFNACAGVKATEELPGVIRSFFFQNTAYLFKKDGTVESFRVPKTFKRWEQRFDDGKIDSNKFTAKEKEAIMLKVKDTLPERSFMLKPDPKPKKADPKKKGTRAGQKARSGLHVSARYRAFAVPG
jgi:hypothetical protein